MTRCAGGFLPQLAVDRTSAEPLQRQIVGQIAAAIGTGALLAGERLPSTRALARLAGVSRNTALAAYEELMASGLIDGRRGAGTHVARGAGRAALAAWRRARVPVRAVRATDPDGNPLHISF